jgi:DNA-binding NtrC family response regulator
MQAAKSRERARIEEAARGPEDRTFALRVTQGPNLGVVVRGCGLELSVGSAPTNQLVLSDPQVSRLHLTIRWSDGCYWAVDMGSRNGTMVNDRVIRSAMLRNGAKLKLGNTTLVFEQLDESSRDLPSTDRWGPLRGSSPAMRRLFALIPRVARSAASVLLEGETGTGKTALARVIHDASPRAAAPFIIIDCAAVPASQLEGLLFGHGRAAFMGARDNGAGAFEQARGGTVFLDKVDELPVDLQPRLVRAIRMREIRRIGEIEPTPIDVRIIAATHRDLQQMVNGGAYRGDLFDLLRIVTLNMPSLRERRGDIPGLVAHFHSELTGGAEPPDELVCAFAKMEWPGNVRELKNAVERAVLIRAGTRTDEPGATEVVDASELAAPIQLAPRPEVRVARTDAIVRWERWYIRELLRHTDGDLSHAARLAQSDRSYLRKLVQRHIPERERMMHE